MAEEVPTAHVEDSIEQLGALYEEHNQSTGSIQRLANRLTKALSRPAAATIVLVLIIAWVVGNYILRLAGGAALETLPFPDLDFVATIGALMVALLILTTQRHEEELAEKRARLTLQIAVLSEKKIAKVIELLEEQRRDNPMLTLRTDTEADAMAKATDPRFALERIEASERGEDGS